MSNRFAQFAILLTVFLLPTMALADDGGLVSTNMAKAIAIGLAALGGGLGQGKAAAAALEGICRNPTSAGTVQTPMLIGLSMIESLVILALVVTFLMK